MTASTWLDEYRAARHAWELAAEKATAGYKTELREYAASNPPPTLKQFMIDRRGTGKRPKGYLGVLVQALTFRAEGTKITIDDLRTELCEAGQIPPSQLGPTFGLAAQKGYLDVTRYTVKTRWRPGKGRLVRVYQITGKARAEAREAA